MGISNVSIFLFMGIKTIETHTHVCEWVSEWSSLCCVWLCNFMDCLYIYISSVQSLSHVQLFATPWTACSTPGFPVHHQLSELAQTYVHQAADAIQPSHPLLSPSSPAFNLSQYQGPFQRVSSFHQVVKVLELQLQHQSFQWIIRTDLLYDWLVWSPCCPRDSQESSPIPQFKSINSLVLSFLYCPSLTSIHDYWRNNSFD